jgi:hypothetical protein
MCAALWEIQEQMLSKDALERELVQWLQGAFISVEWQETIASSMRQSKGSVYRTLLLHKSMAETYIPLDTRLVLSASDSMGASLFASVNNLVDRIYDSMVYRTTEGELLSANPKRYSTVGCDVGVSFQRLKKLRRDAESAILKNYVFVMYEVNGTRGICYKDMCTMLSKRHAGALYTEIKNRLCLERECIIANDATSKYTKVAKYCVPSKIFLRGVKDETVLSKTVFDMLQSRAKKRQVTYLP